MGDLETLFGMLPERYVAVAGAILMLLSSMRTLLRAFVAVCYAIDYALDGSYDWSWVGRLGDAVDRFDAALAKSRWFPVKALGLEGRK